MLAYKKFTKNVGLIAIVNFLVVIKGIIFLPLITKMLGALQYGVWAQLLVTVGLVAPIMRLGLTNSVVRYLAGARDKQEVQEGVYSTLSLIVILSTIVFLFFLLFANPISAFFQTPPILVKILPLIILFECLNATLLSAFQALLKMTQYAFFTVLLSLSEILFVVGSVFFGYGLVGAVTSLLITKVAVFLLIFISIYQHIGFALPQFNLAKKYLSFGVPTLLSNVAYLSVTSIDKYLLAFFLGTLSVGYYAPAYTLGNFTTFLIIPISFVLFPAVSKSYDEGRMQEVKTKLSYSLKYFLAIAIPVVFGAFVLTKQILTTFTTPEIALHAFFVTPLVASSILFYGACDIFSQILTLVKKTRIVGYVWIAAAAFNITLNIVFIPRIGILGAALATLASYIAAFALVWYYSFQEFSFSINWLAITKVLLCSSAMSLVVWSINPHGLFATLATIVVGAGIYGALILLTGVFAAKELTFARNLFLR